MYHMADSHTIHIYFALLQNIVFHFCHLFLLFLLIFNLFENKVKSLVYADMPEAIDALKENIRRVIAGIRPQLLQKVVEN